MESVLAGQTSRRLLPLSWLLEETQTGFRLTARQGERTAYQDFECEHQEARTDQTASIRDVLSKVGDTIYEVTNTEISFSQPWFIPRSRLAEWRREVLAENSMRGPLPSPPARGGSSYDKLPAGHYTPLPCGGAGGGSGGIVVGPLGPLEDIPPLMTCRYCIRYQLGQCLKRDPNAVRGPLYLRGADGRKFLLRFDCKACQMMVEIER